MNHRLRQLRQQKDRLRIAVMGIGHEMRGDDAAGVMVARGLAERAARRDTLLVLDAGAMPENNTGPVRRFRPDLILLVDAAQMCEPPGTVCLLDWQDTVGVAASTHTLPPYILAQYLTATLDCSIALIGIQPADSSSGAPLSPEVNRAVDAIVETLAAIE
ncbi:MAG: hydrogenase 3 maturation endopeptidase HyCI [Anaerolineae bacterium]|nr:hydrogenase 3 maturation endopeptidase HyCI [Anaerolineae bacterium]